MCANCLPKLAGSKLALSHRNSSSMDAAFKPTGGYLQRAAKRKLAEGAELQQSALAQFMVGLYIKIDIAI